MHTMIGILGFVLLVAILWDAFESVILPRHVRRSFRIARFFFRTAWTIWSVTAAYIRTPKRREGYLSYFGPLSLLLLIGFWALALVLAFAMLQWAAGSALASTENPSTFRTDLYFRLNVASIHLPPLRERKEDLAALCDYYICEMNRRFEREIEGFTEEALACLLRYNWPGNVRELKNLIEASFITISPLGRSPL